MVKVEESMGMKRSEQTWGEGGRMQVGAKRVQERQVEGRWRGGGKGEEEGKQVEGSGKGGGGRVVEAKLRGRILVKPREQMWMLQKVKVDDISSPSPFQLQCLICCQ